MSCFFSKILSGQSMEQAIAQVLEELKIEGFGVITEIDMKETLKNKIDADFRRYRIFGACHPHFAYKALLIEGKIGLYMPCNIVVEENENGQVQVSAGDPLALAAILENKELTPLLAEVSEKLKRVIESLK